MSSIILIAIGLVLAGAGIAWALRYRSRRDDNLPYDLIDLSFLGLFALAILAALIIPSLTR